MRRQIEIIQNPTAGPRRRRRLDAVVDALERKGANVARWSTERRGDAEAFARAARGRRAMGEQVDLVVAAGGDGTINEVVNGLAGGDLPLGIIALGTANVLAYEIGMPRPQGWGGADVVAEALLKGPERPVRLGAVNGRRFLMMASVGLDAEAVATVNRSEKRAFGGIAYAFAFLRRIWVGRRRRFRVTLDGQQSGTAVGGVIVARARHYGGPYLAFPEAGLEKPDFTVRLVDRTGVLSGILSMMALPLGLFSWQPGVRVQPATLVEVETYEPSGRYDPVQADGDILTRLPLRVELAETIRIAAPPPRA